MLPKLGVPLLGSLFQGTPTIWGSILRVPYFRKPPFWRLPSNLGTNRCPFLLKGVDKGTETPQKGKEFGTAHPSGDLPRSELKNARPSRRRGPNFVHRLTKI